MKKLKIFKIKYYNNIKRKNEIKSKVLRSIYINLNLNNKVRYYGYNLIKKTFKLKKKNFKNKCSMTGQNRSVYRKFNFNRSFIHKESFVEPFQGLRSIGW